MSLALINSIVSGSKTLSELTKDQLIELHDASVVNKNFSALKIATNNVTGLYDYKDRKPYWLLNDFVDPIWRLEIKDDSKIYPKVIEWDSVTLDDGFKLTHPKHAPLLNAFKYWITATDNPLENGGKLLKGGTVYSYITKVTTLINALLIHGESIQLTTQHLSGLSEDFLMILLVNLAEKGNTINGVYDYLNQVRKFLLYQISFVNSVESTVFANDHPFITRSLPDNKQLLNFSLEERIKACYWLNTIGYYNSQPKSEQIQKKPQGNCELLFKRIYTGRILPFSFTAPIISELILAEKRGSTEYKAFPNRDISDGTSKASIKQYISILKLLNVVNDKKGVSHFPPNIMKLLTATRISEHTTLKKAGRFKTLPPRVVFNLIKECYEFTNKNQDNILDSLLCILKEGATKSRTVLSNQNYKNKRHKDYDPNISASELNTWVKYEALDLIDRQSLKMNIKRLSIPPGDTEIYKKIRNNESLFDLYHVLIGSVQVLTGVIMAKRQDELSNLKSHGNLHPNIDPSSEKGKIVDYQLIVKLKKSGIGGKYGQNATIKRPIPRSFALMIWKLEQFNQAAIKASINKNSLSLFANLNHTTLRLEKVDHTLYNKQLDVVCDYFETPLVKFDNGELRRLYIRQHQLRRFFAMVFFWSRGFDGLDSLRWMLGHTDIEHLYHYISESETGAVLNGVKASYILGAIEEGKLDNVQELADLLAKHYGVKKENISLSTLTETVEDYKDLADYQTTPDIEELRKREELETHILELLNDEVITLEPEFFTVEAGGKKINDFNLTLQVKNLD